MANLAKMALGKISKNDYSKMEKGKRKDVLDFLLKFSKKKNGVNFLVENKTIFGICCKIIENRQKSDFDNDKQNKDRNLKFCYKNDYLDCAFEILTNIFDFYNENNNVQILNRKKKIPKNIKTETPKILFAIFSRIKSIKNEKSKIHKEIDLILKLFNFLEIEDDFRRTTLNLLQILDYKKLNFRISKNFRETTFEENSCEESRLDKIVNCILTANSKIDDKNISLKLWTFLSNNIEETENLSKTAKRIKILSGGLNFDSIGDFVEGLCSFITVGKIDPEIDYERRTKTYFEIKKEMPNLMKSEKVAITPCLNLFFRDLNSDDFGLRNQAVIVIKDICRFLKNGDENIKIENGNKNDIKNSIKKMIVNGLSLKNSKLETKMACMEILRQMLEHKNGVFGDLAKLLNVENEDLDFFVNFFHIQTHRRRKAILQLQKMAKSCFSGKSENGENSKNGVSKLKNGFSSESVSKVLVPLLLHHIINSNAKTIVFNQIPKSISNFKLKKSLREEGLKTLTPLSSFLEWNSTMKWSNFFFKKLKENLSNEKTFVSCICAIIESSQFENSNNLAKINFDKNFFRNIVVSLIDRNLKFI
ncbi:hypothetical protein MHBO_000457 [Bonamia ostreae]|uniref:Uncharacterized protein n=1 Tax=Bonamia ostreae TaxID=126728 RepID=A0ABV2AFQ4_9EUKA